MPAIVIVLSCLILFLTTFLVVLLGPFVGLGMALWKNNKAAGQNRAGISGNVARG
jgi:nicotinamide riboside transporter PnuC